MNFAILIRKWYWASAQKIDGCHTKVDLTPLKGLCVLEIIIKRKLVLTRKYSDIINDLKVLFQNITNNLR